jgi:hypothetical protein
MTVSELIRELQALGIEKQDMPVACVRDDFPRNIKSLQVENATPCGDHWWFSYCPEIDKADGEDVRQIITLREY